MRDATIGIGFSAALLLLAFAMGEPVEAQELIPAPMQEETRQVIGDFITAKTGFVCDAPYVFDYGDDLIVICRDSPTVWTLAAPGDLYENGDMKTAIERNFR